ncbi:MAG: hypothetical protein LBK12_05770 [Odoribacteraceae bacterium]|jgi:hypothetical protein|nr:hypothetical protein [Odoribacteraceae bacterium]
MYYRIRQIIYALVAFFSPLVSVAQFVDLGQDPASVRWRQIETKDFQLIYPDFFEERARELAQLYERLYAHANSLGIHAKKISMIVRANGGVSNGNVGWAPKKSELYTTPAQDPDVQWLEHLCVHEFRHVVQFDKINQGFSKVLYHIFGEQYTMILVGLFAPMWLLEGDATVFETSATHGGRGRSPEFLNAMKARVVEKGIDPYRKAVLGSYKDFIPDRYALGYFLVSNGRLHYGKELWQKVFDRIGRRPYELSPVSHGLRLTMGSRRDSLWNAPAFRATFHNPDSVKRANTGRNTLITFYRDNLTELQQQWTREAATVHHAFDTIATYNNKVYASYHSPLPAGNGTIIAYKNGLGETGAFVKLRDGQEQVLFRPGVLYDYAFCHRQGVLLWSEYKPHPRWEHGGKMVLASYDANTGAYRRYPAPVNRFAPFPVGTDSWGFVEVDAREQAALVVMDASLENELFRLRGNETELFIHPSYAGQGRILVVTVTPAGKRVEAIHMDSGQRLPLTPVSHDEIDRPIIAGEHFIYRAAYNGNNALYRATCTPGQPATGEQIAEGRFGLSYPAVDGDTLYFSFYTADGYRPARIPLHRVVPRETVHRPFALADSMTREERWDFSSQPVTSNHATRKYNKLRHAINVHSWGPFFPNRDDVSIQTGLAVSSQNKLSTFFWTAGYTWDGDYANGNWKINATYRGLWPTLKIELSDGKHAWTRPVQTATNKNGQTDAIQITNRSRRTLLNGTIEFPVDLTRENHNQGLKPYIKYEWQTLRRHRVDKLTVLTNNGWKGDAPGNYQFSNPNFSLHALQYGLILYQRTRMSARDLYPRWGQQLEVGYSHTPFGRTDLGHTWWGESNLSFPGVASHHALTLYAGYQEKSVATSNFGNQILSPRGTHLSGFRLATLRTSYYLPLSYPDLRLTPLLYIKRISAGLFFDAGQATKATTSISIGPKTTTINSTNLYHSFGLETTCDSHFLNLTIPVNFGFRTGYETQHNAPFFNFLFSFGLSI